MNNMYRLLINKGTINKMAATMRNHLLSELTAKPFIENSSSTVRRSSEADEGGGTRSHR